MKRSVMEVGSLVLLAVDIAQRAHAGQFRRDGVTPYIRHLEAVAARLAGESEEVLAVAWLHDVIEDTNETGDSLFAAGIPSRVVSAVEALTKRDSDFDYESYLRRIRECEIARKVKVADMLANLSDAPTEKQIVKYAKGLLVLLSANTQGEAQPPTKKI